MVADVVKLMYPVSEENRMKYEIIQTAPYPTVAFMFRAKCGDIGTAKTVYDKKIWQLISSQ